LRTRVTDTVTSFLAKGGVSVKPAVIVVDMVKDTFREGSRLPITQEGRSILPNLRILLKESRQRGFPVVFANDSFMKGDFIFNGKMKSHSIRGTEGAEVVADLHPEPTDIILPKRRFSAFFKTDLDQTLRVLGADTIVVTGLTTEFCVLSTVIDGLCLDFSAIILEDCTVSHSKERHQTCLSLYRDTSLYPLLRIMTLSEFLKGASI
jgi:nicotinamidase/pyrazinamidase